MKTELKHDGPVSTPERQNDGLAIQSAVEDYFARHGLFPRDLRAVMAPDSAAQAAIDEMGWDRVRYSRDAERGYRLMFLGADGAVRVVEDHSSYVPNLKATNPEYRAEPAAAAERPPPQSDIRSLRILAIDDSPDDVALMSRELERGGLQASITRVVTPTALEETLASAPWDVVLSDSSMPGFDTLAALHIVKSRQPHVPFFIVSGRIGTETAIAAIKAGACEYVRKDRLEQLGPAIERELRTQGQGDGAGRNPMMREFTAAVESAYTMPEAMSISTLVDGRLLYANKRWIAVIGYPGLHGAGRGLGDREFWADPSARDRLVHQLREHGVVKETHIVYRTHTRALRQALAYVERMEIDKEDCMCVLLLRL